MTIFQECVRTSELTKDGVYGYTIREKVVEDRSIEHIDFSPNVAYFMFYDIGENGRKINQSYRVFLGRRVQYSTLSEEYNLKKDDFIDDDEERELKAVLTSLNMNGLDSACKMPNGTYLPMESGDLTLSELRKKIKEEMGNPDQGINFEEIANPGQGVDYEEIIDSLALISFENEAATDSLTKYINLVDFTTKDLGIRIGNAEQPNDDVKKLIENNEKLLGVIYSLLPDSYKEIMKREKQK